MAGDNSPTLDNYVRSIAPRISKKYVIPVISIQPAAEIASATLPRIFHVIYFLKFVRTLETNCNEYPRCSRSPDGRLDRRGVPTPRRWAIVWEPVRTCRKWPTRWRLCVVACRCVKRRVGFVIATLVSEFGTRCELATPVFGFHSWEYPGELMRAVLRIRRRNGRIPPTLAEPFPFWQIDPMPRRHRLKENAIGTIHGDPQNDVTN